MSVSTEDGLHEHVRIPIPHGVLQGILTIPPEAKGIVIFAHGTGSGRFSPRNQFVAGVLVESGLATLLPDLLVESEEGDQERVFDVELLADRLLSTASWLSEDSRTSGLAQGYFGASTGAAAALIAAARKPDETIAIVSRGGRPDLAGTWLTSVRAPTLLIVGGRDHEVLELNQQALNMLNCPKRLIIVSGATHLFEEPGTLMHVANHAKDWFVNCFRRLRSGDRKKTRSR